MAAYKCFPLFHWDFRVWYGKRLPFLGKVEHIKNHGYIASVLAVMDGAYHLHDRLTFVYGFLFPVEGDNGELALLHHAVVHHIMMVSI